MYLLVYHFVPILSSSPNGWMIGLFFVCGGSIFLVYALIIFQIWQEAVVGDFIPVRVDHDVPRRTVGKGPLKPPPPSVSGSKAAARHQPHRSCCWSKKGIKLPLRIQHIILEEFDVKECDEENKDPRPFYISYFDFLWMYLVYSQDGTFEERVCSLGPWWGLSLVSFRYSYPVSSSRR